MTDTNDIPHSTNWAHITITRLGDSRSTRYQISPQSEAKQRTHAEQAAMPIVNKYTRGKYGHLVKH